MSNIQQIELAITAYAHGTYGEVFVFRTYRVADLRLDELIPGYFHGVAIDHVRVQPSQNGSCLNGHPN